ncbi:hypothetical protein B0H21DRAFT_850800 [Amylocystis lapponica]|nr:hypothetical protein B0H21DRAFT_850800 [Amylocystis lapponica]
MAEYPEWFLDPADFISAVNTDPTAIAYPPQLEPPRGWCPTRKKDLKEGWPDGSGPKLRCTFCRRSYSGVNAKSMWRRHVYEKHKIAMSNRRDNTLGERKGRGSNKENKDDASRASSRTSRRGVPKAEPGPSKLQESASFSNDEDMEEEDGGQSLPYVEPPVRTPPLTPGFSPTKAFRHFDISLTQESPYDPLLTPSFRHSPARLPSDQPWRFPSPSHPLHSSARELSLCMLIRGEASPIVSGLDVSPVVIVPASERNKRSIFSSPIVPGSRDMETCSDSEGREKPKASAKATPRRLFYEGPPVPITDRAAFKKHRIPESPLGKSSSPRNGRSLADILEPGGPKLRSSLSPTGKNTGLLGPIRLSGEDPFSDDIYSPWVDLSGNANDSSLEFSPPSSIEGESPVLRSSQISHVSSSSGGSTRLNTPGLSGMGMGLMDAFLSRSRSTRKQPTSGDDDDSLMVIHREDMPPPSNGSPVKAGKKTRREFMSGWMKDDDGDCEMRESSQPKKRRKTVNGRS